MEKTKKSIEIVYTSVPGLSSMSPKPRIRIQNAIQKKYTSVKNTDVRTIQDLHELVARKPDLCFLGCKQLPLLSDSSEMGWVSDFLDEHGIAYTGSNSAAMSLEYSKHEAKKAIIKAGLQTSGYFIGKNDKDFYKSNLSFPLFIKPTNLGNKQGVDANSVVHDIHGYLKKIKSLRELGCDSLVEEYLAGREFSVGVLEVAGSTELITLPVEAIIAKNERGDRILAATNNSAEAEQVVAVTDMKIKNEICNLAKNVFRALGASDYGRIDIRLDENGVANFLEANLIPGLSAASYFPIGNMLNHSVGYDETIQSIVDLALKKQASVHDGLLQGAAA